MKKKTSRNTPKKDGSGKGIRINKGRADCKTTKKTEQGRKK